MFPIRRTLLGVLFAWILAAAPLAGADRVFLLPSNGSTLVTALDAADLSVQASIPANFSSFAVLSSPSGDRYFILTRSAQEAVIVVDGATLSVLRRVSLQSPPSDGELSSNGQDILLAADKLRVLRIGAEEQVIAEVDVGGGAEQVVVNAVSNQAFVLSNGGRRISVVDLGTYEVTKSITVSGVRSIALSSSEDRLVAATETQLLQYRTSDQEEIPAIPAPYEIRSGAELFPIRNSPRMFLRNTGSAPRNTSQIFDLEARTAKGVGLVGTTGLRRVLIVSPSRAFTIVESTQALAEIDLDALPTASVTPLGLEISALSLGVSPNQKLVYAASSVGSGSIAIVDAETKKVVTKAVPPVPPRDLAVVFGPSSKPAVNITINSGNNQFLPPGVTTPNALSVLVTDADGAPLFGVPVLFAASDNTRVSFSPSEVVMTNTRGIASVLVTLLDPEAPAALDGEGGLPAVAAAGPAPSQDENPLRTVVITATTSTGPSVDFTMNIIHGTGLIKISGDFQITEPRDAFPLPFVVLATDKNGKPLPRNTNLFFAAAASVCGNPNVPVDINGFASVTCSAEDLNPGAGTTRDGSITVTRPGSDLPPIVFTTTTAIGARSVKVEKVSGDNQTAPTGTTLQTAPTFLITFPGSSSIGSNGVGVEIRQKSGPAASIQPRFVVGRLNFPVPLTVTLGPRAGNIVIEAVASAPGLPKAEFTERATGGLVVRFEKEGDGQSARIGRFLAQPLRLRVFNESGQKVPFPVVQWKVVSGAATLLTASDSDGATARVQFGLTPGPVVVQGTISGLVATFNVTAAPPQATAVRPISGDGQTLQVGKKSEPMTVEVIEIGDLPALGAIVVFSGPPNVRFHPLKENEGAPANPLQLLADANGRTGVIVELLGILPPAEEGIPVANAAAAIPITATAGTFSTVFALNPLGRTPAFEASGIANGATFVPGLVPGSLATLFGTGLSEGVTGTEMAGGSLEFRGVTIKVGGVAAPILTVTRAAEEQINFQVPFQIPTGQTTTVEVNNNGSAFSVGGVPVFSSQPGIFMVQMGGATPLAAIVHPEDFSVVTPEKPAEKGKSVALFFTGGGLLSPAVATGVPGPVPAAVMALPITVKVDGKDAEISFKGYAPGLLGVYQLNFAIPAASECGVRSLNLSVAGSDSPAVPIAVKCQ